MSEEAQDLPRKTPALRFFAHLLYLPLIAVLVYILALCLLLLGRDNAAAARALLYGVMLFFVGRRYARIYRGQIDGPQLWKDVAALAVVDVMLAVLLLDYAS